MSAIFNNHFIKKKSFYYEKDFPFESVLDVKQQEFYCAVSILFQIENSLQRNTNWIFWRLQPEKIRKQDLVLKQFQSKSCLFRNEKRVAILQRFFNKEVIILFEFISVYSDLVLWADGSKQWFCTKCSRYNCFNIDFKLELICLTLRN